MLTYSFEKNSKTPLYEQLYGFIREDILAGRLPPHSKLPSKRALAQHLTLSVATVQNAYAQLIAEGYLYTKEKQGHFVSSLETNAPREKGRENSFGEKGEELLPKKEEYFFDLKSNSLS